ncbi:protein MAIN-LIKE 1-like [Salvia splendens]|uniref:protein MAIN-LIKE 1-like n=1 Tax=Salvia splendens TaxID=180675 RepID=UPI001C265488|nr:protein MAIN-LIKE 1-like [Salvia splendens]
MATSSSTGHLLYGPEDPSVLNMQKNHISNKLMKGGTTQVFKVRRTESKTWDAVIHENVRYWLDVFGFKGVIDCGKPMKVDNELITALIERWRPETHTFHLPIGETTITLASFSRVVTIMTTFQIGPASAAICWDEYQILPQRQSKAVC